MGSIGCPLCCRHEFVSVSALHEHLLYYTYRPLRCAVCGSNAAGIQGLIHHLAQHLGDNLADAVQKVAFGIPEVNRNEREENTANDNARSSKNAAPVKEYIFNNTDAGGSQSQSEEPGNHSGREEPVELTLRAYVCQCCGAKVVGKDKYFFHIKQHNTILNVSNIHVAPSITLSAPQSVSCESEMAPDSHYTSDTCTPVNVTTEHETLAAGGSDPFDKGFPDSSSNYMDENDTATQLLKLREWQLEKHGKRFKRHRQSFTKSPCPSELSPLQGRMTNSRNSPVVNSQRNERASQNHDLYNSMERQPLSHSSYASSMDFEQSPSIYKELPLREDTNNSNLNYVKKTPVRDIQYNSLSQTEESQRKKETTVWKPSQEQTKSTESNIDKNLQENSNHKLVQNDSQIPNCVNFHQPEQLLPSENMKSSETNQSVISPYEIPEPTNESENISTFSAGTNVDNQKNSFVSSQVYDISRSDLKTAFQSENTEQLQTTPLIIQPQDFQTEVSSYANSDVSHFGASCEREIQHSQQTEMNECFPSDTDLQESLQALNDSPNCSADSEVDIESSVFVTTSWVEPNVSAQYLELKPPSKAQNSNQYNSSRSKENADAFTKKITDLRTEDTNEETENIDSSLQNRGTFIQSNELNYFGSKEKYHMESESVSREMLQSSDRDEHTKATSTNLCGPLTQTPTGIPYNVESTSSGNDFLQCQPMSALDEIQNDPNFLSATKYQTEEDSNYKHYYSGKDIESSISEKEILPSHSSNALPYLHKKFHHDQERRVASTSGGGQNADMFRYIHNFQSLLVSRLNAFSVDTPLKCDKTNIDTNVREKEDSFDHNQAKLQKQLNKDYVCEVCNFECTDSLELNLHYKNHEGGNQKNFKCKFCKLSFFKKNSKDRHEKKHTAKKVYRCSQCQQVFNKLYTLNRHQREVHAVKRPLNCDKCGKSFTTLRHLQNHVGVHQTERQHKCKQCKHSCHTASGLRTHIMEVHSGPRDRSFDCKECGEKFVKQYGLNRHMQRKHMVGELSCTICSKSFSCNEDLIKHTKSHETKTDLNCEHCKQTFTSAWSLQRHSIKHQTDNNQFKCTKCSKTFTRKDSLTSHEKLHAQKKNYECKCGKRFVRKSQLTAHEDKHSSVPKYSCDICKHSYKFKISLKNHSCKPNIVDDVTNVDQGDKGAN